jgi:hypothetical protein
LYWCCEYTVAVTRNIGGESGVDERIHGDRRRLIAEFGNSAPAD